VARLDVSQRSRIVSDTLGQVVEKVKYLHIGQDLTPKKLGAVLKYLKKAGARFGELKRKQKHFHTLTRKFEV
jgi:hypothetical protein